MFKGSTKTLGKPMNRMNCQKTILTNRLTWQAGITQPRRTEEEDSGWVRVYLPGKRGG